MSKPKFTPYVDTYRAMKLCMDNPSTIFIGQQIVYYGNPMSKTIEGLPKERMIETPVMEETQMGMTMGLNDRTSSCYILSKMGFFNSCLNQLINHLDKLEAMSDGEWKPNVIVRVGKGSDKPLDPGHQHKADYTKQFKEMLTNATVEELKDPSDILPI